MNECIECGAKLDDFTAMEAGHLPKAGDFSICRHCSHVAIYAGNLLDLREPTAEEVEEIRNSDTVQKAILITKVAQMLDEQ